MLVSRFAEPFKIVDAPGTMYLPDPLRTSTMPSC